MFILTHIFDALPEHPSILWIQSALVLGLILVLTGLLRLLWKMVGLIRGNGFESTDRTMLARMEASDERLTEHAAKEEDLLAKIISNQERQLRWNRESAHTHGMCLNELKAHRKAAEAQGEHSYEELIAKQTQLLNRIVELIQKGQTNGNK